MKNLSTLMGDKGRKPKDQASKKNPSVIASKTLMLIAPIAIKTSMCIARLPNQKPR